MIISGARSRGQRCLNVIISMLALLTITTAWPSSVYAHRRGDELYPKHVRRNYCANVAGKCFSSGQCCRGLLCAAFDDYFGQKPEVPGYCVMEKDLEVCVTNSDCNGAGRCVSLGRTGERYCVPRPYSMAQPEEISPFPSAGHMKEATGDLGSQCEYNGDCRPTMERGGDKLCCQDVRRGRQGVRRICDRVTPISACITTPR